jgi:type I thyroxine 5'-deiodinase
MYKEYGEQAAFFVVYIEEAHAADSWQMPANVKDGVIFDSPQDYSERAALGSTCVRKLGIEMPALVDDFENSTEAAYTGWPDRLYVVDKEGRIAHKSGAGPFGFHPDAMEEKLNAVLGKSD